MTRKKTGPKQERPVHHGPRPRPGHSRKRERYQEELVIAASQVVPKANSIWRTRAWALISVLPLPDGGWRLIFDRGDEHSE